VKIVVREGICQECGKFDILGYISSINKKVCPECASPYLTMKPSAIREFLNSKINN
jgi:RNA polymerase subunit RPABC4/transcription elongation factor Spt4